MNYGRTTITANDTDHAAIESPMNQISALDFARLKDRVAQLEKHTYSEPGEFVEGWSAAAKLIGVHERTVHRRVESGSFPTPCRIVTIERKDGDHHEHPVWRRKDLLAYAEGKTL